MYDIIFVFLTIVYFWFSSKMEKWDTIRTLGMILMLPEYFIRYPWIYNALQSGLFIAIAVLSFGITIIPWHFGLGILVVVWLVTSVIGRTNGFNELRKFAKEMENREPDVCKELEDRTPDGLKKLSQMTNKEMIRLLRFRRSAK